jgi:RNA polymerase sigma-70 factor (ECF subfamily)
LAFELRNTVNKCLSGNPTAALELVRHFQGQVFGLCYRMLGHRQDAEDATQETFFRVLKNLHRWDQDRDFEPWLLTIAGNRCRTRLAKRMRNPSLQSLDRPVVDQTWQNQSAELLGEEVDLALTGIRPEYRQAFLMFHQHQLSYDEIATAMKIPLGTVKTWVYRARRQIVLKLEQRGVICARATGFRTASA